MLDVARAGRGRADGAGGLAELLARVRAARDPGGAGERAADRVELSSKYRLIKPVAAGMFRRLAGICVQDETYAKRFVELGREAGARARHGDDEVRHRAGGRPRDGRR